MTGDRMQRQRFEFKYLVDEAKALAVRGFLQGCLVMDDHHGRARSRRRHPAHQPAAL